VPPLDGHVSMVDSRRSVERGMARLWATGWQAFAALVTALAVRIARGPHPDRGSTADGAGRRLWHDRSVEAGRQYPKIRRGDFRWAMAMQLS
jgi:hypothetical protein